MGEVVKLAWHSVVHYLKLVARGQLHLEKNYRNQLYGVEDNAVYKVFRATISSGPQQSQPGVVLVVGFRLKQLRNSRVLHWLFQRVCILTTPFWSGFPGFRVKLWMVDPLTHNYLGIYDWSGEVAANHYVDALTKVLIPLSVPNSVWHRLLIMNFADYLQAHQVFKK